MKWKGRPKSKNVEDRRPKLGARGRKRPAVTRESDTGGKRLQKKLDTARKKDLAKAKKARMEYYKTAPDIKNVKHASKGRKGPRKINKLERAIRKGKI